MVKDHNLITGDHSLMVLESDYDGMVKDLRLRIELNIVRETGDLAVFWIRSEQM